MSIVKSFSVGEGDMFYIDDDFDSITVIDCFLNEYYDNKRIMDEMINKFGNRKIKRFISTHPDDDHIKGLKYYKENFGITDFYCVRNNANKKRITKDFEEYRNLRDSIIQIDLRKGRNITSSIDTLWPDTDNHKFKEELIVAEYKESPNNISPIIRYTAKNGMKVLWFGDLENSFMEEISYRLDIGKADIIFAPHHGRESGRIPKYILDKISPKIIVLGEAPSKNLDYYGKYNTLTQNTAGDITFNFEYDNVYVYVSNKNYDVSFLKNKYGPNYTLGHYIGTLEI